MLTKNNCFVRIYISLILCFFMIMRQFEISDAHEVSSVIRRAIMNGDNRGYSLEHLYSISNHYCAENICSEQDLKTTYVFLDGNIIVGTATLRGDEIMAVFILLEYQGKGIGKKFMNLLEEEAVKKGLSKVWSVSRLPAVSFYRKLEYSFICEKIHSYWGKGFVMEKSLI